MKTKSKVVVALSCCMVSFLLPSFAVAQTSGMERRGDRRDNRDEGREEKAECKAGDEQSRPECRQDKRDTKQEGRGNGDADEAPAQPVQPAEGS